MGLLWKELGTISVLETGYGSGFAIRSYYQVLTKSFDRSFPWKIVWKSKVPSRVVLFVWTAALENILTIDNLRKRQILILDWCCMWKKWEISWPPPNPLLYCFWFMVYGVYFDWYSLGYAENSGGAVGLLARKVWEAFVRHRNHKLTF